MGENNLGRKRFFYHVSLLRHFKHFCRRRRRRPPKGGWQDLADRVAGVAAVAQAERVAQVRPKSLVGSANTYVCTFKVLSPCWTRWRARHRSSRGSAAADARSRPMVAAVAAGSGGTRSSGSSLVAAVMVWGCDSITGSSRALLRAVVFVVAVVVHRDLGESRFFSALPLLLAGGPGPGAEGELG